MNDNEQDKKLPAEPTKHKNVANDNDDNKDDDKDDDESSSDVELEGIDLDDSKDDDDDDKDKDDQSLTDDNAAAETTTLDDDDNENDNETLLLQHAEEDELNEARRERLELMQAEQPAVASRSSTTTTACAATKETLDYLLAQSDVFAHFLAGSVAAGSTSRSSSSSSTKLKKGTTSSAGTTTSSSSSRGQSNRLTEAQEDAQLLKSANSKRRTVRLQQQPTSLAEHCHMHPYQLEGLNWLIKLHDCGINGILADEMGLGKTLQTISLWAYLRESRGVKGPHLCIVPKSVVGNWMREIKKWCPEIRAMRMGGTKEERAKFLQQGMVADKNNNKDGGGTTTTWHCKFDVLITSYEGVCKEKGRLRKVAWKYLVIDEAHRIKNEKSALSMVVRQMNTQFRMLITGTPLQNNLRELWALLNFIMPDIFGDADQFDTWFSLEDDDGRQNVIKKLHTVLRPFMLRRVKKDVTASLPPKKETKLYVGMTEMQHDWYVRCLRKDAHELNKLGGPDRNRLLNVLMQLRKVCNHPYLFDGAEAGPPFVDGPHLWETSGKMQLLHKLLPKLKEKKSRVLIFCQMTRVLDILEDYCRLVGHEYCRIDGNTDGEKRDSQMDEFNAEGSSKFCFLLSTRAGGLGINLATADIVILFDSDWNPQVDLQAMDRAHRIGQKKPVQVFRLITEGTVEEKIIERADRKLFLDAAVIQQGRLAEQHSSLEKGELMKMVQFGADLILSGKGGTYTDEDIDALIARGEEKTSEMQAKMESAKHNLANFSLLSEDDSGRDTFSFDGKNYRDMNKNIGNFINLPQRQRKRNYDLSAETGPSETGAMKAHAADAAARKKRKGLAVHPFQLFDMERLNAINEKEKALVVQKEQELKAIADLRQRAVDAPSFGSGVAAGYSKEELLQAAATKEENLDNIKLSEEEEKEKKGLMEEGFPDWTKKDFKAFCQALEIHGRYEFHNFCRQVESETGKTQDEIRRYFVAFWSHYERVTDWQKIIDKIEKGEKKILRLREIRDAIQEKVERHLEDVFGPHFGDGLHGDDGKQLPSVGDMLHYSWPRMRINYGSGSRGNKGYTEEEDAFLVCMMYRHGYGAAERIRMEIRRAWQFRFDWYFKSRSAQDIQRRCEVLVKIVERENEELRKKEDEESKSPASQPEILAASAACATAAPAH